MHLKSLLPLLLAVVVFSCQRTQTTRINLEDVTWVARKCTNGKNEDILCPYSFLRIYHNGTFVAGALRGFVTGTWNGDSSIRQVLLVPDSSASSTEELYPTLFQIEHLSDHYLNLAMVRDENDIESGNITVLKMKASSISTTYDPFHPDAHAWRKKPLVAETPGQVKARARAYILFLKEFYLFASANKIDNPDNDWFPNVMNMEQSGSVRMAYSNELKDWYECFYNEEQAVEGYKIISGPFLKVKLQANTNLNERNANVAGQILNGIDATP